MAFTDAFLNYRPAPCCGNCYHGYDRAGHGSRNCSKHCGAEVVRSYVCDDWRSEGGEDR